MKISFYSFICSIPKADEGDTTFLTQAQVDVPDPTVTQAWQESTQKAGQVSS